MIVDTSLNHETCKHPRVIGGECYDCGQHVGANYGIEFGYIQKGLRLSHDEVVRLREVESERLFRQKKLHLVLDIDHTLLHTVPKPEEKAYLEENAESLQGCVVMLESILVKLRPFVHTFLKEASTMFEMYLYTKGNRSYAMNIARLLDPQDIYFGNRIISRDDGPEIKTLDLVLGQKHAVLILDDTESVWPRDRKNLILIEKYEYFAESNSLQRRHCETGTDESESSGALANKLRVLKVIHKIYFDPVNVNCRNVMLLVELLRHSILKGCTLYFNHFSPENSSIFLMAKELGAKCTMERNSSVTHLVLFEKRTNDIDWAVQEKKLLVNPQWIEAAYYSWQRQPEGNFALKM